MINARLETVSERPAYRRAFERYRCLIVADGFYEWQRQASGPKQPFHITRDDGGLFAFAGLWSIWHAPDGEQAAHLHDHDHCGQLGAGRAARPDAGDPGARQPSASGWTRPRRRARLQQILAGLPGRPHGAAPVSLAVNDARYDGPECLAPPSEAAQTALF